MTGLPPTLRRFTRHEYESYGSVHMLTPPAAIAPPDAIHTNPGR